AGLNGTRNASTAPATGQVDGALSFSGSAGEDNVASTFALGTTNVTMECWANLSSTSLNGSFIKIGGTSPNQGYAIGVGGTTFENTGNKFLALYEGQRWIVATTYTAGWHHFALVINATGKPIAY